MNEISWTLSGDKKVLEMFAALPRAAQERVLKGLVKKGGKRLAGAIEDEAPAESGLLRRAVGVSQLKTYGQGTIFITAGVRRGFRRAVTMRRNGRFARLSKAFSENAEQELMRDPVRYLHLVTGGRKAILQEGKKLYSAQMNKFFGKQVAKVDPNPFVDRAFRAAKEPVLQIFEPEAPPAIEAEAAKLGATA
jgi:hypothetical protein